MTGLIVTGGAGFIGANFVRHWRHSHPDETVVVLDALTYAGNRANIDDLAGVTLVHGDIRDTELVLRLVEEHQSDTIVNFAAESHVDNSISDPDSFVSTNIVGTHSLLKAAKTAWLDRGTGRPHRFHQVSTDEVYGDLDGGAPPARETSPYVPSSPYSATKAASDHLVAAYHRTYGLETTISNCANNYGPFQFPEKLIPLFILNALKGINLPIYGDGLNVRNWLFVEDHCRGLELVLGQGRPGETYNIGGGEELPNLAVIDEICRTVDQAFALDTTLARRFPNAPAAHGRSTGVLKEFVADRPGHDRRYALDDSKARGELSYRPRHSFAAGLERTLRWYLAHEEWWRPLIGRPSGPRPTA